jgi:valyl-tRNA synthetase
MDSRYDPAKFEAQIYQLWLDHGVAKPVAGGRRFVLTMPPANVTGNLHMGHALTYPTQDAVVRFHRLLGEEVLYVPGTDHAGIATQLVVERELKKEHLTRTGLGRRAFVDRVWQWREHSGGQILSQLRRLGVLADWDRLAFTLDAGPSRAVRTFFQRAYHKGLIYRGAYIVNWCPRCRTALSDLEVVHHDTAGTLWQIAYPVIGTDQTITVATTRPETMLGDMAVAVHPDDARHRARVGQMVQLPLTERQLPVIADAAVDMDFGTGAVKVTPAHDADDFAIGIRHQLEPLAVIDEDGKMINVPHRYLGLSTTQARELILSELQAQGVLVGQQEHLHAVGHCERCDTVIEPRLSQQWFLSMKPLAEQALAAVARGDVSFHPDRFTKIANQWLENIHDWCISRQLWWGHQIPAWYCADCGATVVPVADETPSNCPKCAGTHLTQDEDVLNTWFSSALWPFSTLGWPEQTADLARYFPTQTLVTGSDILFFWVIRMLVASLELTDQVPFGQVMLHGLVRDSQGQKMSKTRGNGIDPLLMIERHGADALRWSLLTGTALGQDVRGSEARVLEGRNFTNKIWNAARLLVQQPGDGADPAGANQRIDRWLRDCVAETAEAARALLLSYELGAGAARIQDLFWDRFCDVYLETLKGRLNGPDGPAALSLANSVLADCLIMLHPFVPFVTEAIWQSLRQTERLVATATWPAPEQRYPVERRQIDQLLDLVRAIRNLKADAGEAASRTVLVRVHAHDQSAALIQEEAGLIAHLAGCELVLAGEGDAVWEKALSARTDVADAYLRVGEAASQELGRLERDLATLAEEIGRVQGRLDSADFLAHAPAAVVAKERARLQELAAKHQRALDRRRLLQGGQ